MKFKVLVGFLLIIITVVVIVLAGVMGLGKKIGAPGLDKLISQNIDRFLERVETGPFPETTLPGNMQEIIGTWSGISDKDGAEWRFTFEQNYAVRVSNSKGYYRQGTAFVHWKLGLTDGNIRMPRGWTLLDMDIIQSSETSHRNTISLGAYSRRKNRLEYCFSEPGMMVRPITNESREGISCFELTAAKAGGDTSDGQSPSVTMPHHARSASGPQPSPAGSRRTQQAEKIIDVTNFHARILVKNDGTFTVHETMQIFTNGITFEPRKNTRMLSGIYRSISSRIQGKHAYYRRMAFEMIDARMDGNPILYSVETTGSWFTSYIFLAPDGLVLSPGEHEFTLDYTTDRHITFLPEQDEFFWWVFGEGGHGWATSVGRIEITVVLPEGSHGIIASLDDYSWNKGTGKIPELLRRAAESGETNVLHYSKVVSEKNPYLSVVVGMPKGTVHEPDISKRMEFFFRDMIAYLPGIIGLTVFFLYYLIVWVRVGRDPEGKSIVPRYKPPADCSPAFARHLLIMRYDRTVFASALLDLASKGIIRILGRGDGYVVEKTGADKSRVSTDEEVLYGALFGDERKQTSLSEQQVLDAVTIHRAYREHHRHLMSSFGKRFFLRNARYVIPGVIISLVVAAINAEIVHVEGSYVKELTGLGLWTIFAGFVCRFLSRKNVLELKKPSKLIYLLLLFPAVLYSVAVSISHAFEVFNIMQFMFLAPLFIMLTAHVVFLFLLRAPTPLGRNVLDEIEGFRTYLAAAEGDRLDRMTPPKETPKLYQEYLPYALALGVENRWSEKFSGQIDETYTLPPLDVFLSVIARFFSAHR
ncbi:MAG: DUF2207 domain-containing protein [Thermodesulfovibrionales bacterium]|nr:DUF2207 domain-containing protein [Thermodesulfovibrionales bacterium]